MALKDTLMSDLQDSMRSGDELRKSTIRMARSAIKNAEIQRMGELDPAAADPGMIRGVDRDGRGGVDAGSSLVRRLTVHSDLPGKDQGAGAFT